MPLMLTRLSKVRKTNAVPSAEGAVKRGIPNRTELAHRFAGPSSRPE
jgi:hypothetical protein